MKSTLDDVRGLYVAIFTDLQHLHPTITKDLQRDFSRLQYADSRSGLSFYTIVLPSFTKFLERSLDEGYLISPRPPYNRAKSKLDQRPQFLWGLWASIFEADGTLSSEPDISSIASLRQVFLAAKKLQMECEQKYVDKSISQFREIEKSLPVSWDHTWDDDHPIWCVRDGHPLWGDVTMDTRQTALFDDIHPMFQLGFDPNWRGFRNFVARFAAQLGNLHSVEIRPKHGPGAISDKSQHTKYDGLYWTDRLEPVFPYDWFGAPSSEHLDYVQYREFPSLLMAVPKTQSGPRLIAAEPTAHQWIQGGVQRWLELKLKDTILKDSIDFRDQDYSRNLAQESSKSGSHATVDLSSASDRLSTRLVEYIFQSNRSLLDALHACRTRVVKLPDGEQLLLRKFSTQGSACTFPVQTIVFSLIAVWAIALTRNDTKYTSLARFAEQVRVFGDDIIIPTDSYPVLKSLLETCGLLVNTSKSHANGKFREACGMDAYDGVDVTPAYFRQTLGSAATSLESLVECSNNFHKKGMWHTADYLLKTVPIPDRNKIRIVGTQGDGAFGFASFCGRSDSHLRRRWNRDYHIYEVQALLVLTKVKRVRGRGHGDLLQFFVEEPQPDTPYSGGQVSGLQSRKTLKWVDPGQ